MQLLEPGLHAIPDFHAEAVQPFLNLVQMDGRIAGSGSEIRLAAHVPLAAYRRRDAVEAAGDGAVVIKHALIVRIEERTADAGLGGLFHDVLHGVFRTFGIAQLAEIVALHTSQLAIHTPGVLKDTGTLGAEVVLFDEPRVQVHGFDKRKVKHGVAAITATGLAGHAVRVHLANAGKHRVGFSNKCLVRSEHRGKLGHDVDHRIYNR